MKNKWKWAGLATALLMIVAAVPLTRGILSGHGESPAGFDPLATARASAGLVFNKETPVPPQCYAKTERGANTCWVCHTESVPPNAVGDDLELQAKYEFAAPALENHWHNLFVDRAQQVAAIGEAELLAYIRQDNYAQLRFALKGREDYAGFVPDVDLARGFDGEGFARDGSGWRAVRFQPFPGEFWPTNGGSVSEVLIRLPAKFRTTRALYKANLAILEAAMTSVPGEELARAVEPVDEQVAGFDLDGDGRISGVARIIRKLPSHYAGEARDVAVHERLFPEGVEFLHPLRYLDPDAVGQRGRRLKELRYSRKHAFLAADRLHALHDPAAQEDGDGDDGPEFRGTPLTGLDNGFGWTLQGFIEDREGRLRLQTEEEHRFCVGCHGAVGVTADHTFSFARKVPGFEGWRRQNLKGLKDRPQLGHERPEVETYLERAGGGDDFRSNRELTHRFFIDGKLNRRALAGKDLADLLLPSRERALNLGRAYLVLVRQQAFAAGRVPAIGRVVNVHRAVAEGAATGLEPMGRVFRDGRLWVDWTN